MNNASKRTEKLLAAARSHAEDAAAYLRAAEMEGVLNGQAQGAAETQKRATEDIASLIDKLNDHGDG